MSSLKGHLEHFGLQELLQTLSHGARTGTLQIERDHEKVAIVFETGHITFVRPGTASQIRLRSILLRCDMVSEQDLLQARDDQKQTGMLLGRALLERGVVDDQQLAQALRLKAEEELFDLFLWEHGTFEFFPDQIDSTAEDQVNKITRIQVDPMSVIIEGLRQADEWKIIRDRISDLRWILIPVPDAPIPAESHSIWKMIDGQRSIEDILKSSTVTRFDTCSILYRFIEEGSLREATAGEMLQVARGFVSKSPATALPLYQALIDRAGESLGHELLDEAADCAAAIDPDVQSQMIRRSAEILKNRGDEFESWNRLQRLLVLCPGNMEDLKSSWILRKQIPARRIDSILDELVKSLRRAGDHRQLLTVLREAETVRAGDANYWLLRGEVLHRCKNPEAGSCLSRAIQLSKNNQPEIALRAEKILRNLDPELALDENLVEKLRKRRDILDSSRKLKKKAAMASLVLASIFLILHLSSEWRAQGLLAAAKKIETSGLELSSLLSAVEAYERVATEHPWTFAGSSGTTEGIRLRRQIDNRRESEQFALETNLNKQRSERIQKLVEVRSVISKAKSQRKAGDATTARATLDSLSDEDLKMLPEIELNSLLFPVVITSKPAGARIYRSDRSFLGKSPVVVDLRHDEVRQYTVERSGCRTSKVSVSGSSNAVVNVSLVRGPLRTYSLPNPVNHSALTGKFLVTTGRDGTVRIIDTAELHPIRQQQVGVEGHPAPLLVEKSNRVLVVPFAGRPVIVEENGSIQTFGPTATAPWSTACHLQRGWVLGDVEGNVIHLNSNGSLVWEYQCKSPITLMASLKNKELWVIDKSRYLHRLDSDGNQVGPKTMLAGDAAQIFPDGRILFQNGFTWKSNQSTPGPKPVTGSRNEGNRNFYGTERGWVVLESNRIKKYTTSSPPSCAPLQASEKTGGIWVAGIDGILRLQQANGEIDSEVELGSPAVNLHRSSNGQILVTLSDGRLCDVEELQR